jgi:hypothetical protein
MMGGQEEEKKARRKQYLSMYPPTDLIGMPEAFWPGELDKINRNQEGENWLKNLTPAQQLQLSKSLDEMFKDRFDRAFRELGALIKEHGSK